MIYPFPIRYRVTSSYTAHLQRNPPSKMPGTDYATPIGTPIYAIEDGWLQIEPANTMLGAVAISLTSVGGARKWVLVHLSRVVGAARNVKQGELIGYTGNTGRTTGAHTHISLRKPWNGQWFDCESDLASYPLKTSLQNPIESTVTSQAIQDAQNKQRELQAALEQQKQAYDLKLAEIERQKAEIDQLEAIVSFKVSDSADLPAQIVTETVDVDGLFSRWGGFVDQYVKSQTLRSILKYDMFVYIGAVFSYVLAIGVSPYLLQQGLEVSNGAATLISLVLGIAIKILLTRYDTNKDGQLTKADFETISLS